MVRHEDLQEQRRGDEQRSHDVAVDARHQAPGLAHRGEIGRDVERVGDEQAEDHALQHDGRERGLDVRREPLAGCAADEGAHALDGRHERVGERHGPEHVEPELRAGLRVGRDAARIVVRRTGNEPRSHARQRVRLYALPPGKHHRRWRRGRVLHCMVHGGTLTRGTPSRAASVAQDRVYDLPTHACDT